MAGKNEADALVASLKQRRKIQGLTHEDVAVALGVHVNSVSRWEKGERSPQLIHLAAWCELLGGRLVVAENEPEEIQYRGGPT